MRKLKFYRIVPTKKLLAIVAAGIAACGVLAVDGEPILWGYHAPFCDTHDVVNIAVTIRVDSSTANGAHEWRYDRIGQQPSSEDLYCLFSVQNGLIVSWCNGEPLNTPSVTFIYGIAPYTNGGLRVYDNADWSHKAEFPASDGGTHYYPNCPPPPGIVYNGEMTLDFGSQLGHYSKPWDVKSGGDQCERFSSQGMARYSAHSMLAELDIEDTPIHYTPPYGGEINFTATYNQNDTLEPGSFKCSHMGPKWTFNWLSCVIDQPMAQRPITIVYTAGGGSESYTFSGTTFSEDPQSHAILVRPTDATYEKHFPDGSKQVFAQSDGAAAYPRRIYMTQWIDPAGNAVQIHYQQNPLRIDKIIDALGRETNFYYENEGDPLRITKVIDPFGRSAIFGYDPNGRLNSITDPENIQSAFHYSTDSMQPADFIDMLTTPYGPSHFSAGHDGTRHWIDMTDPMGGLERVEYRDNAPNISGSEAVAPPGMTNSGLGVANTFYWDKKYTAQYNPPPYDYTLARIIHWAKNSDGSISGIKASEKAPAPLENRVWYAYAGQSDTNHAGPSADPSTIARVLDDGTTTQASQFVYNSLGNITQYIDPNSRVTSYGYDTNLIDLTAVYQSADQIAGFGNYSFHRPGFATDAAGQTTTYIYNPQGQLTSAQNARQERMTYTYSDGTIQGVPIGYLASITSPQFGNGQAVTSFTYDSSNRVRTVTNSPDNYAVTTDYDGLDRPILITYSDSPATTQQFKYTRYVNGQDTGVKILDLTASKDRLDRWTVREYDGNRRLTKITDPLNRATQYGWCNCGSLTSITDSNQHVTTFGRDLLSRVTSKAFADTSAIHYTYETTTSRLKSMTDASGQVTNYQYFIDDDLAQVSYTNPQSPTPTVNYTYDPNYNRLATMSDGTGQTNYSYYPVMQLGAGQLSQVAGPLVNDTITYTYDQLGRVVGQSINDGFAWTTPYDSLGRPDTTDNMLGHFTRTYDSVTPRLLTLNDPNGQASNYTYFDNSHDRRLQTLHSVIGPVNLSQHDYTYDPEGQIQTWTKTLGTQQSALLTFSYDNAQQLTGVSYQPQQNLRKEYDYDNAGNRLTDLFFVTQPLHHGGNTYTANNLNQLDTVVMDPGNGPATGPFSLTYYGNGNLMADAASNRTFEWDAANRLVAINYNDTHDRTEFAYDGLGRRVKITEYGPATMAVVQPKNGAYVSFKTAPFTLPTGAYEISFTGLNPNSGNNTAFIDQVTLNGTLVTNGGFETPQVNNYATAPSQSNWSYTGNAGIAANGGGFIGSNPPPPEGNQAAFVTNNSSLSQIGAVAAGTYALSFKVAQRASGNDSYQQVRVTVRGALSTKTFVWSGNTIAEERDSTGSTVTKRFFAEGEQRIGGSDAGSYYYSRDHLGSVREVTDASGTLQAQYDYDAWGNSVVVSGNMNVDFGFTGHYFHQPSGLNLSLYRAYNATLGRWISRDPIGEAGGVNLYAYVGNNSMNAIDPLGLWTAIVVGGATWKNPFGHVAIGVNGSGVYSFGTQAANGRPTPLGSSFSDFLNSQAASRSMDVYLINTTPEQEAAILGYLKTLDPQLPEVPGKDSHDTCASRTNHALSAAGLVDPSLAFLPLFNLGATSPYPGSSAIIGEIYSHGFVVHIPQGALYQYGAPFTYINPR